MLSTIFLVPQEGGREKSVINFKGPTVWPGMCPMGLHQDPKANYCLAETSLNATDCLQTTFSSGP